MEKLRKKWIDRKIPDLKGAKILITGGTSGIGYEAALGLAYKGAHVYIACRNLEKAQKALAGIKKEVPAALVDFVFYDQGNLDSIHKMAEGHRFFSDCSQCRGLFPHLGDGAWFRAFLDLQNQCRGNLCLL
jgi:nucleoside-diphosphate-sugar epimerase